MNKELMEALDILEKEKNISKDTLLGAIEQSLIQACKNHFGKADNVHVTINPETCDFSVYAEREVKEFVYFLQQRFLRIPYRRQITTFQCFDILIPRSVAIVRATAA